MKPVLDFSKQLLMPYLDQSSGAVIDFTMGNGHDTLFLAEHSGKNPVYAFDIQQEALSVTKQRLDSSGIPPGQVTLILDSHHRFPQYVQETIQAGIFNLGYLPGGDKTVATNAQTTLATLTLALDRLSDTGILIIVLYPGHPAGREESRVIEDYCRKLPGGSYDVLKYDFMNKKCPPYLLAVTKHRRDS